MMSDQSYLFPRDDPQLKLEAIITFHSWGNHPSTYIAKKVVDSLTESNIRSLGNALERVLPNHIKKILGGDMNKIARNFKEYHFEYKLTDKTVISILPQAHWTQLWIGRPSVANGKIEYGESIVLMINQ